MGTFKALDKDSNSIEFQADGNGSTSTPFIPHHKVIQSTLPQGAATEDTLANILTGIANLLAELQIKASVDESQLIQGTIEVNNFPENSATSNNQQIQITRLEEIRDRFSPPAAIAPKITSIPLNTADTEVPYTLTDVCSIVFQVRFGSDVEFRYSNTDAYYPLEAGVEEVQDFSGKFTGTLYLRSSSPGTTVVIKECF